MNGAFSNPEVGKAARRLVVIFVDIDKNRELTKAHGVRGIPAVLFFKSGGEPSQTFKGRRDAQSFIDAFTQAPAR